MILISLRFSFLPGALTIDGKPAATVCRQPATRCIAPRPSDRTAAAAAAAAAVAVAVAVAATAVGLRESR